MVGSFEADTVHCPLQCAGHTERAGRSVVASRTFRFEKCFHNKSRSGNENKMKQNEVECAKKREKGRKETA